MKRHGIRNITLSLPTEVLRRAKILAIHRGTSLSGLLRQVLEEIVSQEEGYATARRRNRRRLAAPADLGTEGRAHWTRDQLHER